MLVSVFVFGIKNWLEVPENRASLVIKLRTLTVRIHRCLYHSKTDRHEMYIWYVFLRLRHYDIPISANSFWMPCSKTILVWCDALFHLLNIPPASVSWARPMSYSCEFSLVVFLFCIPLYFALLVTTSSSSRLIALIPKFHVPPHSPVTQLVLEYENYLGCLQFRAMHESDIALMVCNRNKVNTVFAVGPLDKQWLPCKCQRNSVSHWVSARA